MVCNIFFLNLVSNEINILKSRVQDNPIRLALHRKLCLYRYQFHLYHGCYEILNFISNEIFQNLCPPFGDQNNSFNN